MKHVLVNLLYLLLATDILLTTPEAPSPGTTSPMSQEKQLSQNLFWTKARTTLLELEEYQLPS